MSKENKPDASGSAKQSGEELDPATLASVKVKKSNRPKDLPNPFDRLQPGAASAGKGGTGSAGKQ